ncbi:hypothetical protein Cgig2_013650 [Carnegiea gigantea]|uniref:Uncharacterized protein n=1 Tax=Carnegiea gigantea TaxID=171969 RepID=A0A9Q1JVQ4_9CARY|nr:hypothetical protein Cgig2_013650 [Carnegiea gigantea]
MEYDLTKLRTGMSPYGLCNCLSSILDEQKRNITELGFEFLLTLRVDKISSRLARWLVKNFDTCRRAVKLASNDEVSKPVEEAKKSDKGEYKQVLDDRKDQLGVNLKEVKDLNWCKFMLDSLISYMDKWKRQPKGAYRDPILFLMACVQKISRSLRNFARFVIEVVDVVSKARQMFPASTQMDKVQGFLNQSKLKALTKEEVKV